jgi:hypothetical protein
MPFFKITLFSFIRDLSHCRVFWSKVLLVARVDLVKINKNVFVGLVFIGTMFKVVWTDTLVFTIHVNMSTRLTSEFNKETYLIDVK